MVRVVMVLFHHIRPTSLLREGRRAAALSLASLGLAFASLSSAPTLAQPLPYHADPDARDILPNLQPVPAIRFLTTTDFPPFNFRDATGELVGFNVDLARRICVEVNVACTLQAWPWDQAANALSDRQGDALIAGLAITDENGALFDFSATYLALPGRFVTRAVDLPSFQIKALAGKTIGVREGSTHAAFVAKYLPETHVSGFASELEALEAVKTGQVDAYFGDAMRASFWLNDNVACCGFAGEPYFRPELFGEGLTIALPAGTDAIRHAIDWALVRLKNNGTLDELYLRWFPVGFY